MADTAPYAHDLASRAQEMLARLVAFDTTSRNSNLALIEFVESWFGAMGVNSHRVANQDGSKTNLYATIGPMIVGGVVLSGHTDVVPVDGQPWSSAPFVLTERGDRLYGRGTCDMKGFLALALAAAPDFAAAGLKRPIHFALSYDEEVGCLGAPSMIRELVRELPHPTAVVVGEPTDMQVVNGHKGISSWRVVVTGHEAHSSLTHLGLSAVSVAVELMHKLTVLARQLEQQAIPESGFVPPHATLTIGQVNGGTAVNILARECSFVFDLRTLPGDSPDEIIAPFLAAVQRADQQMRARFADAGASVTRRSQTPALAARPNSPAVMLARRLAGDNGPDRMVPYAAEGGQFQEAGFDTVICGPGSIEQAHQPDEYVEKSQILRGAAFMQRLIEANQS